MGTASFKAPHRFLMYTACVQWKMVGNYERFSIRTNFLLNNGLDLLALPRGRGTEHKAGFIHRPKLN